MQTGALSQAGPRLLQPVRDGRSEAQVLEHYLVERELAERLRCAPDAERRGLYPKIYDELFRRLPEHPQLRARADPAARARREQSVRWQLAFLRPALAPGTRFLEIGAGDGALAARVARQVARVYALDVSQEIMSAAAPGVVPLLSDGTSIPLPAASVDVAFSNQLLEHLHPRDALEQLREVERCLAPGGRYFCITPNRWYGPRDVSQHFDEVATGLHLREYSARELRELLLAAGFARVHFYAGARTRYARVPFAAPAAFEALLARLPYRPRKRLADNPPARALLGLRVAALKGAR